MDNLIVKYRPKIFEDVIGQNEIIKCLKSQLEKQDTVSAYLFSGPSGCGKTTVARILTNALNGEENTAIEIDGATYNGVDNMREIVEDIRFSTLNHKYKIYIIDECHQLTTASWNVLLKVLEDMPNSTKLIFCTTNPNKIPITILSRVQHFRFNYVKTTEISKLLTEIVKKELNPEYINMEIINKIALCAKNKVRQALNYLNIFINSNFKEDITSLTPKINPYEISKLLGVFDTNLYIEIILSYMYFNKDTEKKNEEEVKEPSFITNIEKAESLNIEFNVFYNDFLNVCLDIVKSFYDVNVNIPGITNLETTFYIKSNPYVFFNLISKLLKMANKTNFDSTSYTLLCLTLMQGDEEYE